MKTIRIKYVDFWPNFKYEDDLLFQILKESSEYNVCICEKPDYIVYSVFGKEHLKYDCVRIFFTGEECSPDFNVCDYAIGFDYLSFQDRYFRLPLMYEPLYYLDYINMFNRPSCLENVRGFCSFVYSNNKADPFRNDFFIELSKYKKVSSGGLVFNNVGGRVDSKLDFEKKFKFSIAFENVSHNGYVTEKIMQSFAAGCVPIYWGDPSINNMFNKKAFININDYKNVNDAIEYIKYLDQNKLEYEKILKEKPLLEEYNLEEVKNRYKLFVNNIFEQEINHAFRTTRKVFNYNYLFDIRRKEKLYHFFYPVYKSGYIIKKLFNK